MNNLIKIFILLFSVTYLSSCCADVTTEKYNVSNSGNNLKNPTSIAVNKSIVTARVDEILSDENGNFTVRASIVKVEEDPSYPSLAMAGKSYNLIPNFQLDDNKKIISNSETNKNLSSLSKRKPGYEFKAVIFFENLNGWFIQEIISN
jgi:hypothetical protein